VADKQHRFVEAVGPRPEQMALAVTSNVTLGREVGHEVQYRAGRQDQFSNSNRQQLMPAHYTIYCVGCHLRNER